MATTRRRTPEEFLKLPEEKPYPEPIDGVVVQTASPQEQHGYLQSVLAELINKFGRRSRRTVAIAEHRGRYGGGPD